MTPAPPTHARARGPADLDTLTTGDRLPALDGLRAAAVLVVMVAHFGVDAPGELAVTLFFVLSGFLITRLLLRERALSGSVSLRRFYARRTLRIFPAYYLFVAVSIAAGVALGRPWSAGEAWAALTYTFNYYLPLLHQGGGVPAAHAWSLAVEEQFYLLWPPAFLLLARRGRRALAAGLAAAVLAAAAWRAVLHLGAGVGPGYLYVAFDTRFDSLAVGCLLAVLATRPAFAAPARALAARPWLPALTLLLLAASQHAPSAYVQTLGYTVDSLLLAVLLLQALQLHRGAPWSWLDWRPVRWLGAVSYPMYLWHMVGLGMGNQLQGLPAPLRLLAGTAATVALAAASYYAVERPALALRPRVERFLASLGRSAAPGRVGVEGG